jgi:cytochrome c oxidase cbb3-type subunit 1
MFVPGFLNDCPWITVGRLRPAAWNVFIYGFAVQAGLGTMLWLLARLGNAPLRRGILAVLGGGLWNLGVLLGLIGILRGDNTGFSWLEFPGYSLGVLFFAYLLVAVVAALNFNERNRASLYPSQWYLVAAIFWFPWILSTAVLLLLCHPVRGVAQVVVDGWFKAGLGGIWLPCVGLAVVFYLLPKLLNRPLYSGSLASFGFWTMLLFCSWRVAAPEAPVPAWITGASTAAALLALVPVLAVGVNIYGTMRPGVERGFVRPELFFVVFAAACYLVANVEALAAAKRGFAEVTRMTLFSEGQEVALLYGFGAMSLFGAIHYITPRVLGLENAELKGANVQFWTSAIGVALLVFVFSFGGVVQGRAINNPQMGFGQISDGMRSAFAAGVFGIALIFIGQVALVWGICGGICKTVYPMLCACRQELVGVGAKPAGARI